MESINRYIFIVILLLLLIFLDLHQSIDYKIINTKIVKNASSLKQIIIVIDNNNKTFIIDLIEQNNFISNNNLNLNELIKNKNCHYYKGNINKEIQSSFAAISYCDNLINGIFYTNSDHHYQLEQINNKTNLMKITKMNNNDYHHHHHQNSSYQCGFNDDDNKKIITSFQNEKHYFQQKQRLRRDLINDDENKNENIFQQQRYVEMVLVNDYKLYEKYKGKLSSLYERNVQIVNIVNALYSPFNISIILVGVVIWKDKNEIQLSNNSSETLNNFLKYRRDKLLYQYPNDNAQLITAQPFENGIVGKALKQTMCTYEYSGGVNYDYNESIYLIATTIAHELGHNFGMEHDNENCKCKAKNCIMGPSSSYPHPRYWSSCSVSQLKESLEHGLDYCLMNKPLTIFKSSCGNGIIDDGEDCDCGLPNFCTNKCCNATTCKFMDYAKCSDGVCCDRQTCQIIDKYSNFVCRQSKSICDPAELCNGQSENCPHDQFITDGTECKEGYAYCFNGKCETRENRCHLLWGNNSQVSSYRCYENNANANSSGNCGYDKKSKTFIDCKKKEDIICGRLHCTNQHNSNRKLTLKYGPEGSTVISQIFESHIESITCFSVMVDLGLYEHDLGLVPDGAKCGNDKMCIQQKCVPIKDYQKTHCDRHPFDDQCQQSISTNRLILTYFLYFLFISSSIALIIWFLLSKKSLPFSKNWLQQKAFIQRDYHHNRRRIVNPINRNDISTPLETELNNRPPKPIPIRPAPPIPKSTTNNNNNISTTNNVVVPSSHHHQINHNQIHRPKRSPPPPPSQPSSQPKNKVKDLVKTFENN